MQALNSDWQTLWHIADCAGSLLLHDPMQDPLLDAQSAMR